MENTDSPKIRPVLYGLGFPLFGIGATLLARFFSGETSIKTLVPAVVACAAGLFLIAAGYYWKPAPQNRFAQKLAAISSNPTTYLFILFLVWVYVETLAIQRNNEIIGLRNDQQSIADIINRFVLPRHLDYAHGQNVVFLLMNAPPLEVTYKVVRGDEEASNYRADIQKALERAGWHAKKTTSGDAISYVDDPGTPLSLTYELAPPSPENPPSRPDPKLERRSDVALRDAFAMSGVAVSSYPGAFDNATSVTITIGHRRGDAYPPPCQSN